MSARPIGHSAYTVQYVCGEEDRRDNISCSSVCVPISTYAMQHKGSLANRGVLFASHVGLPPIPSACGGLERGWSEGALSLIHAYLHQSQANRCTPASAHFCPALCPLCTAWQSCAARAATRPSPWRNAAIWAAFASSSVSRACSRMRAWLACCSAGGVIPS